MHTTMTVKCIIFKLYLIVKYYYICMQEGSNLLEAVSREGVYKHSGNRIQQCIHISYTFLALQ